MEPAVFVRSMGKAWVKARRHDRFYRAAKKQAYRSRAAIKLSQIDLRYGLFRKGDVVVDLVAVSPLAGVEILRGDFREPPVQGLLFERLGRPADVVVSDMAPRLSGHPAVDVARSLDLAEAALSFAIRALRPGGQFLVKVFQGDGYREYVRRVAEYFAQSKGVKPSSSSERSSEIFILGQGRL
jgi:23S rRNA (uridine2552-2'-O)-methyltransferase